MDIHNIIKQRAKTQEKNYCSGDQKIDLDYIEKQCNLAASLEAKYGDDAEIKDLASFINGELACRMCQYDKFYGYSSQPTNPAPPTQSEPVDFSSEITNPVTLSLMDQEIAKWDDGFILGDFDKERQVIASLSSKVSDRKPLLDIIDPTFFNLIMSELTRQMVKCLERRGNTE